MLKNSLIKKKLIALSIKLLNFTKQLLLMNKKLLNKPNSQSRRKNRRKHLSANSHSKKLKVKVNNDWYFEYRIHIIIKYSILCS